MHPGCAWKDIFDLFCIQQDRWEDTAVAGSIRDEEQQVTAGNLLCHKHPARKEWAGESTSLLLQHQGSSPGITWPTAKKSKENRDHWKLDVSRKWERHSKHTFLASGSSKLAEVYNSMLDTKAKNQTQNTNQQTKPNTSPPQMGHHVIGHDT